MAIILLGWELGSGLGHVRPMRIIAEALVRLGHQPVFAVKNLVEPWPLLKDLPYPILQAPIWADRPWVSDRPFLASSYSDILALRGYTSVEHLLPMVQAWQALLDVVRPQLVICDHAPTLCLAASGRIPTVLFGAGFNLPPADQVEFPALIPHQQPLSASVQILEVVREVQSLRKRPLPETLPSFLTGNARFITVLPELDPYQKYRYEAYCGPLQELLPYSPAPATPAYFAYLAVENSSTPAILRCLARSGYDGQIYIRGSTSEWRAEYQRQGLRISNSPLDLRRLVSDVSIVIHHGGMGLAELALSAGRPQVVVPGHLEQYLTGQLLESMGVGSISTGELEEISWNESLHRFATSVDYSKRAISQSVSIHQRGPWQALNQITECCQSLLIP